MTAPPSTLVPREQWLPLARAHEEAVDALTAGHRERRARGEKHPVEDFLFDYYRHRVGHLRRWHPGHGVVLADAPEYEGRTGYVVQDGAAQVDLDEVLERRGASVERVRALLTATLGRPAHLGCFGMHEWAMVYRLAPGEQRHEQLPLRLGQAATDEVVERSTVRCSHFDAYRFFTQPARPLNALRPTREAQVAMEQPGCLHAGMDLYKWCFTLAPLVPSALTLDAFLLAREIRVLDMQASPYDVSAFDLDAVAVETPAGRAEYARRQRDFAARSDALRRRLLEALPA
ncbi:3-methyladenine DNA glycosylase [Janibacter melonis]|uniref:3-methyladenine DNA glycosylase n=1 Tax=Janibacter melonis TaxID=262209 RepID=A0A176QAD1_9MICO|nr:3-methyladenine DNA glycosylase [Janibacter melonis]OAB86645.1 3-methyladenine DNA glycosylase [Janibacter melonis]